MKVQKIVSLDVETAKIAESMPNFSRFVRNSLKAHANDYAVADEMALRHKWVSACRHIAAAFADYARANGVDHADADELVAMALAQRRITEWIN